MSRALKELLANDHPLFLMNIARMERASGNAGIDVRLIADITERSHEVIRQLRLDSRDITGPELYRALLVAAENGTLEGLRAPEYLLINLGEGPISLNVRDVLDSLKAGHSFQERSTDHAQRKLRAEIIRRYAEHERTQDDVVHELARDAGLAFESDTGYTYGSTMQTQKGNEGDSMKPTILAVGDIFGDAFIKLREDQARIDTDADGSEWLSMPFGSKPPYEQVDLVTGVGPSPNAAVSFSRLGLDAHLRAFLGDDEIGRETMQYLAGEKVNTDLMSIQEGIKSNYYYVLRYGADRTILVRNEDYDYTWKAPEVEPEWLYLSLLSDRSWQLHQDVLAYLELHPNVKLAFQPGTFHFHWGAQKLAGLYARSEIVILNREEAVEVTGKSYDSLHDLAGAFHDMGVKIIVITDGPNGSYASYDGKLVAIPNFPDVAPPEDRTGAGDAFASTIVAALAMGESMDTAFTWAPINSANVVQHLGAQAGLLTKQEILDRLATAPDWYHLKEITE